MKEKGIDWNNEEEVVKFSEFSALRLAGGYFKSSQSDQSELSDLF